MVEYYYALFGSECSFLLRRQLLHYFGLLLMPLREKLPEWLLMSSPDLHCFVSLQGLWSPHFHRQQADSF